MVARIVGSSGANPTLLESLVEALVEAGAAEEGGLEKRPVAGG
jgi:hypothetical protein